MEIKLITDDRVLYVIVSFATFTIEIWSQLVKGTVSLKLPYVGEGYSFYLHTGLNYCSCGTVLKQFFPDGSKNISPFPLPSISCYVTGQVGRCKTNPMNARDPRTSLFWVPGIWWQLLRVSADLLGHSFQPWFNNIIERMHVLVQRYQIFIIMTIIINSY
jgi:hypothetical protein